MTHDGANPTPLGKDWKVQQHQDLDADTVDSEELRRRLIFRTTIHSFVDQGFNIALIDGLEWMDTKVGRLLDV